MQYVGTFGSGWTPIIKEILKDTNIKIIDLYDGFVIFETTKLEIKNYRFFNNVYLLLNKGKIKSTNIDNNICSLLSQTNLDFSIIKNCLKNLKHHTFKIKAINESQPTKIKYNNLINLENLIKKNLQMKLGNNSDIDFLFLQRSEGFIYFLLKLTYNRQTEKNLKQGTLRPEVCYLLAKFANIQETDIILDPFCGSGAIPKEIIKSFKYNICFASDIDETKVLTLKKEYKNNNKKFFIKVANGLNLDKYDNKFIDIIITDPPWNLYNKSSQDFKKFYIDMLNEFSRILKDNGKIVILMGNITNFEEALNALKIFQIENKLSVLVNGKKANAYLLTKIKS